MTPDRLSLLQTVRSALGRSGLPVPAPLASAAGETIARYGDRLAEQVSRWLLRQSDEIAAIF